MGLSALVAALVSMVFESCPTPLLLALDFDGTLAPLQDDPERSQILPSAVAVLRRLADAGVHIALVSGRGLATLARLAEVPLGTILVGSHGAEVAQLGPGGLVVLDGDHGDLSAAQHALLAAAGTQLSSVARGRDGVWVEAKPAAVVIHARIAEPEVAEQVLTQARTVGARLGTHVLEGKDVVELSVTDVDKGTVVAVLRDTLGAQVVVYAGDDRTDENALAMLRPQDVGIKVGAGQTLAQYRVPDPQALVTALEALADALTTDVTRSSTARSH